MGKYLVQYTHVEETTYEDWVEADSKQAALDMIEEDPNFEKMVNVQGVEIHTIHVIEEEDI